MTIRVGFLGAGFIATFHSKMLRSAGVGHERAGVYDPDRERAEAFVAAAGGWVADSEEAVLDACDAVYVCTPTVHHPRQVALAVDRDLAVFCEKPLGTDLVAAQRTADLLVGTVNQVGLVLRWSPAFALVESMLQDEEVGDLLSLTLRDDQHLPTQGRYGSTWRGEAAEAGSGVLLEHSIHDLDLLDRLSGGLTSIQARAVGRHGIDGIEDVVHVTAMASDAVLVSLQTVWHDNLDRPGNRALEAHCSRAHLTVTDDWFGPVTCAVSGEVPVTFEGEELLAECARRGLQTPNPDEVFLTAVRDHMAASPDAEVARRAHRLVDAAYRSAAAGGHALDVIG